LHDHDEGESNVAGVGQRVDHRAEDEVAAVLATADVDQGHTRRDAADAEAVEGRGDRSGHVCAVPVVVLGRRVDAVLDSHGQSIAGMSVTKLRDFDRSTRAARSG